MATMAFSNTLLMDGPLMVNGVPCDSGSPHYTAERSRTGKSNIKSGLQRRGAVQAWKCFTRAQGRGNPSAATVNTTGFVKSALNTMLNYCSPSGRNSRKIMMVVVETSSGPAAPITSLSSSQAGNAAEFVSHCNVLWPVLVISIS